MKKIKLLTLASIFIIGSTSAVLCAHTNIHKNIQLYSNIVESTNKSSALGNSNIQIINYGGQVANTINFNTNTMKLNVITNTPNSFLGSNNESFFTIKIYGKNGSLSNTSSFSGLDLSGKIKSELDNTPIAYGGIIEIKYNENQGYIYVNNNKNEIGTFNGGTEYFRITRNGLKKFSPAAINVNSFNILGSENIIKTTNVTGCTTSNAKVTVIVNNHLFSGISDKDGKFNIKITSQTPFTANTKITVIGDNSLPQYIYPAVDKNIKLINSSIQINNRWGSLAANLKFNLNDMKINISDWNKYLGYNNNNFLNLSMYNSDGVLLKSGSYLGNNTTSSLDADFNNLAFQYGDILKISYDSSQGKINLFNGKAPLWSNNEKMGYFKITKNGLIKYNLKTSVCPFDILGENIPSKEGILSGATTPDTKVEVIVNSQSFSGISNKDGEFNIKITSQTPFTSNTKITVIAKNTIAISLYPSANKNIQLTNSGIYISNENSAVNEIKFNVATMTLNVVGNSKNPIGYSEGEEYLPQYQCLSIALFNKNKSLIKHKMYTGKNISSDIYNNFNNLPFKYGDIIELSNVNIANAVNVFNANSLISNLNSSNSKINYFEITKNGLEKYSPNVSVNLFKVLNQNFFNGLLNGINSGVLTGKTDPNTTVYVILNNKKFTCTSDSNGNYTLNINNSSGFNPNIPLEVSTSKSIISYNYPAQISPIIIDPLVPASYSPLSTYDKEPGAIVTSWTPAAGAQYGPSSPNIAARIQTNAAMNKLVEKLTENCTNDYSKAEAIYNWEIKNIPYSLKWSGGNAITTFEHGGVCEDLAVLYSTLCRQAGIVTRIIGGNVGPFGHYANFLAAHAWNEVWIPSMNKWISVDPTWHLWNCQKYIFSHRSYIFVAGVVWNPNKPYSSYFQNDPKMAWYHWGIMMNQFNIKYLYNFNDNHSLFDDTIKPKNKVPNNIEIKNDIKDNYWTNYGYVINGNIQGIKLSKNISKYVILENQDNKIIYKAPIPNLNWYSNNKMDYSGYQCIITPKLLKSLKANEIITPHIEFSLDNKVYTEPISIGQKFKNSSGFGFTISHNKNNIYIVSTQLTGKYSKIKSLYKEPYGYVLNLNNNFSNILKKNSDIYLVLKNTKNNKLYTIKGVPVDWYSLGNYSGAQFIISNALYDNLSKCPYSINIQYDSNKNTIVSRDISPCNIRLNNSITVKIQNNNLEI